MASLNLTPRPGDVREQPLAKAAGNQLWPLLAIAAAVASLHLFTGLNVKPLPSGMGI